MKLAVSLASILLITSCTSIDPYTGEKTTNNAGKGIGIGAIAGALIGAATSSKNDRAKGILNGALGGAAVGVGAGYYMDKQEAQLRHALQGSGVQVRRDDNNLVLIMPGNITFQSGKHDINSNFFSVLDSVKQVLTEYKKTAIKVIGHTDSQGAAEFNQILSEKRANSVRSYFVQRGITSGRVQALGYGERFPVDTNLNAAGRENNRRVELTLEPTE